MIFNKMIILILSSETIIRGPKVESLLSWSTRLSRMGLRFSCGRGFHCRLGMGLFLLPVLMSLEGKLHRARAYGLG